MILFNIIYQIILNLFSAKSIDIEKLSKSFNLPTTTIYYDIRAVLTLLMINSKLL